MRQYIVFAIVLLGICLPAVACDGGEVKLKIPASTVNNAIELLIIADALGASDHTGNLGLSGYSIQLRNANVSFIAPNTLRIDADASVRGDFFFGLSLFGFSLTETIDVRLESTVTTEADGLGGFSLLLEPFNLEYTQSAVPQWIVDLFINEQDLLDQIPELRLASYTSFFPGSLSEYFEDPIPDVRFENNSIVVFLSAKPHTIVIRDVVIDGVFTCSAECFIYVGPGVTIKSTAQVTLRAGKNIIFHKDIVTEDGATIDAEVDPTLIPLIVESAESEFPYDALQGLEYGPVRNREEDLLVSDIEVGSGTVWNVNDIRLIGSRPNPFHETVHIDFYLHRAFPARLRIFDMFGKQIAEVFSSDQYPAGQHSVEFKATGLPPGTYIYSLQAGPYTKNGTMVLTAL